jgi:hypothetical protein
MTGSIADVVGKDQTLCPALIAAPFPPPNGPTNRLGLKCAVGSPAFISPAPTPGGYADDL